MKRFAPVLDEFGERWPRPYAQSLPRRWFAKDNLAVDPMHLIEVSHPRHWASRYGLAIEDKWISHFWNDLADRQMSVRFQVHTHPCEAFHSATDDAFPLMVHSGFLSLVIPDFAMGPVGFRNAYLTENQPDGTWWEMAINERICVDE